MGKTSKRAKLWARRGGGTSALWRWSVVVSASLAFAPSTVAPDGWAFSLKDRRTGKTAASQANVENAENTRNDALDENKENRQNKKDAALEALEEAFFETLGRCESPLLVERNEAEDALFERFAEFELIWQDRRFLTNGEVGAEARQRFELAEARYREKAFEECVAAFKTTFEAFAPESEEGRARDEKGKNDEQNRRKREKGGNNEIGGDGKDGGTGEDGESGKSLRGRVFLRWEKPLRIVYLSPDWSAFERRDAAGNRWRPSGRFSAPELAPEFDASELTLETIWERVDGEGAPPELKNGEGASLERKNDENGKNEGNSEKRATVVGVLKGVVGGDFRVWTLPLNRIAIENAADRRNGGNEKSGRDGANGREGKDDREREKRDAATDVGGARPSVFQSGDAVATVGETTINEDGGTTARVRFDFAEAFDAFDSHRVWCDKDDFELVIDIESENLDFDAVSSLDEEISASRTKTSEDKENKTGETSETGVSEGLEVSGELGELGEAGPVGQRWAPIRLRVRERSVDGALFELDFPNDAALREAVAQGRARLACRIPRFFFEVGIEIRGIEKRNDEEEFNGYGGKIE